MALRSPGVEPSQTAALVVDLRSREVVFASRQGVALRPASNEKLVVSFAALLELGPEFRIATELLGEGERAGAVWGGDLVLKGHGDPTLSSQDLRRLARRVRASGIRRVTGDVVADESAFDSRRTAPGWKPGFYREESPPLSALVVDGARVGAIVVEAPALQAASLFEAALREAGVDVAGRARIGVAGQDAVVLGRVRSPRLASIVERMNRDSDNFAAEMLLKVIGSQTAARGTTGSGARVARSLLEARGIPLEGVRLADGSGLSRGDRLTAAVLVELLLAAWEEPRVREPFLASLPVAGISGTLEQRMGSGPARGLVRAKTGTTSVASTLSGYVGSRYAFAILMNGSHVRWSRTQRSQDRFVEILAGAARAPKAPT